MAIIHRSHLYNGGKSLRHADLETAANNPREIMPVKQGLHGVFFTGAAGNGKSTLAHLFGSSLFDRIPRSVVIIDMSDIIRWGLGLKCRLGKRLRHYVPIMRQGEFLPDTETILVFIRWLEEEVKRNPALRIVIVPGAPRTKAQLELLRLFETALVTYIRTTRAHSDQFVRKRFRKQGEQGRFEIKITPELLNTRWNESQKTESAVNQLNGQAIHLDRVDDPQTKLHKLLTHLSTKESAPFPRQQIAGAIRKLETPGHRIHQVIQKMIA